METTQALHERQALGVQLLGDVKTALIGRTQWSPVLATVIDCMPDSLILSRLEARQNLVRRRIPAQNDPGATIDIDVPVRALQIDVYGYEEQTAYRAVRDFQERLRSSALLAPRLDALTVSQEAQTLNGRDVVSYELSCVFKPVFE